ncbi:MAG: efflux RND transporter permease subunit, partial [Candidatus Dadabacteria bacterium]
MGIHDLIEWSDRNRFMVAVGLIVLSIAGVWALRTIPLDAIPDLSDTQVIVFTEWPGRSPDLVEDQITYPIVTALIAAPNVKVARGVSFFGLSFVYVLFEDGTDIYWARSRVLEYMSKVQGQLPDGVTPTLGPDATGVGWGFQYVLEDTSGTHTLAELRSFQDWYLRYWLESVPGVAEVAPVGGYVRQYQVTVDPVRLLAHGIGMPQVVRAVQRANNDVGGRIVEMSGREYIVRGRGYVTQATDLEEVVLKVVDGVPVRVRDVGDVTLGPEIRRGAADWNGQGEVVGGIVVVRFGENVLDVIDRVKKRIEELRPSLPEGVQLRVAYDRSDLIHRSIDTLTQKLIEEMIVVSLICIIFLWHLPSAFIALFTLPLAVLLSFLPMRLLGLSSNIMSLGGIAIAIGAMVDAAIVMVENAHKQIERDPDRPRREVVIAAAKEVGRPLFFSLVI